MGLGLAVKDVLAEGFRFRVFGLLRVSGFEVRVYGFRASDLGLVLAHRSGGTKVRMKSSQPLNSKPTRNIRGRGTVVLTTTHISFRSQCLRPLNPKP